MGEGADEGRVVAGIESPAFDDVSPRGHCAGAPGLGGQRRLKGNVVTRSPEGPELSELGIILSRETSRPRVAGKTRGLGPSRSQKTHN